MLQKAFPNEWKLLLMQGNLSLSTTTHCLGQAKEQGARTVINPSPIHFSYAALWPWIGYVVLNEAELQQLSQEANARLAAGRLIHLGARCVITTLGGAGARLSTAGTTEDIPTKAVTAEDTTGAGDVFCGVFAAALAAQRTTREAAAWAVRAATLSVTRPGSQRSIPSAEDMRTC